MLQIHHCCIFQSEDSSIGQILGIPSLSAERYLWSCQHALLHFW